MKIITISREFGSGGHTIGKKLAQSLQIPFYDGEIVTKVAMKSGYSKEFVEEQGEYSARRNMYFGLVVPYPSGLMDPRDKIYDIQRKIILEVAHKGPCVIVGRSADYILRDAGIDCLNVFIYADKESRKARILERYGKTDVDIEKRLTQKDRQRKFYYKYYTDRDWGTCQNYDICLNSGVLGEEKCIELIQAMVK